jgi:polar amino acid transport system substrate-binding protein
MTLISELVPTGTLRAGMNLGNTLFTIRDPVSGELRGVAPDLMRELASRLGVPVEFMVYATPGEVADAAGQGAWDVAVLAIEAARARTIMFSPAMTEIEAAYVVHKASLLRSVGQVDTAGVRISAAEKAGYELFLTRTLRNATVVRAKGFQGSVDLFNAGQSEALAGLKPALLDAMDTMPDARMLEGVFMTVNHGIGVPQDRPLAAACVRDFVMEMIASGFVARSIARNCITGLAAVT